MARELTRRRGTRDTSYATPESEETAAPPAARGSRRGSSEERTAPTTKVSKGWGSYKKTAESTKGGDFAPEYKPREGERELVKILDDGPFAVFKQHWIIRPGKKSWSCLLDEDGVGDCPLCNIGDKPKPQCWVNVIDMLEDPESQEVRIWKVGSMVGDILRNAAEENRTKPINKKGLYWQVEKIKKSEKKIDYRLQAVKEDADFENDWDTQALTDEEFETFQEQGYDDSEPYFNTVEELQEIADEVSR